MIIYLRLRNVWTNYLNVKICISLVTINKKLQCCEYSQAGTYWLPSRSALQHFCLANI